jgi:hypothetical protein
MKLYEISEKFFEILKIAEQETYETGEISAETVDLLEKINCDFEEKVDAIASYIKSLNADENAIDCEAKALQKRKERKRKSREFFISYLQNFMKLFDRTAVETPRNAVKIRKNPESVWVADEFVDWASSNGQDKFLKFKNPEPNKTAIKEALKSGEMFSFAQLIKTERLEIK